VSNEEFLPADIVALATSDARGRIFVETKSLDGETNLKGKFLPKDLVKPNFESITINYEGPNPYLSRFNGSMGVQGVEPIPIGADNFLLRGCKLMNTDFVDGVVVYTGHDTKIMLNSEKGRPKKSKLESMMNYLII
jgi:magnesium-transporting ATPase (P-type)